MTQLVELSKSLKKFEKLGYSVVAIGVDTNSDIAGIYKKHKIDFPILNDKNSTTIKKFKIYDAANETTWPATFIVDKAGKIVFRDIRKTYKKRPLAEDLLEAISGL
jgi:peroxiredoxin